jgi:hypothetical protein
LEEQREQVQKLMIEDYEQVIFYLLKQLGHEYLGEINVVMKNDGDEHEHKFMIRKRFPEKDSQSYVHRIEYVSQI